MNRKSNAANLRKSIKPRESHIPGSAGVPSSSRRGLGNRTILETTRNSVGSSRMSHLGQVAKKDPRTFNEEFIQTTFRRLRDFLTSRHLVSEMPTSPKLTARQFESLFLTLMKCIFPGYYPPPGTNWIEVEVPIVMESLSYPQKVMKSTLQTVSSKVGPIMGIIDFLIDLAMGMDCDHQQAIRLLSRDVSPNQFDLEIELLAQSTFTKGVTVDAPHIQELIKDFCARHKGVADGDAIREEREQVLQRKAEAEATLQALELQQTELESVQEECENHRNFIVEMEQWKQRKEQELLHVREQRKATSDKLARVREEIAETKKKVDAQPISQEDIRRIRAESKDLEKHNAVLQQKIDEANKQIEKFQSDSRIQQEQTEGLCKDVSLSLAAAGMPEEESSLREIVRNDQETEQFLGKLKAALDDLTKRIADSQTKAEERLFELDQQKKALKTAVEFANQDMEAVNEKISFFGARLAKKEAELLSKRQALKNSDNMKTFADREVEDLKIQLKAVQEQLEQAKKRCEEQKALAMRTRACTKAYGERIDRAIKVDRQRMAELVKFYKDQEKGVSLGEAATAIVKAIDKFNDAASE